MKKAKAPVLSLSLSAVCSLHSQTSQKPLIRFSLFPSQIPSHLQCPPNAPALFTRRATATPASFRRGRPIPPIPGSTSVRLSVMARRLWSRRRRLCSLRHRFWRCRRRRLWRWDARRRSISSLTTATFVAGGSPTMRTCSCAGKVSFLIYLPDFFSFWTEKQGIKFKRIQIWVVIYNSSFVVCISFVFRSQL